MTSRIKRLQHAKLYLSPHVTNTKSMTPNQLRLRASGFRGFRHIPLGPCSGFKAKRHGFYSSFSSFVFLEDYIGLHTWVILTYYGSSTCLRPALQGEKRYIISQPIGTIWCAVCELDQGGMFKVDYAKISIDQKTKSCMELSYHNGNIQGLNFSIKSNSIVQLKVRVDTQSEDTKVICKSVINCK